MQININTDVFFSQPLCSARQKALRCVQTSKTLTPLRYTQQRTGLSVGERERESVKNDCLSLVIEP